MSTATYCSRCRIGRLDDEGICPLCGGIGAHVGRRKRWALAVGQLLGNLNIGLVARSVGLLVSVPLWGLQPTVLTLYEAGKNRRGVAMFAYAVGLLVLFANLLVANVAPLTDLVLGRLLGAGGELFEQARIAFLLFAFLPPLLAVEQIYSAALLARRRANPFILINMLRLGGLAISVLLALLFAPAAIWVGVAGECGGLATESGATYAIGRGSYRQLAGRRA